MNKKDQMILRSKRGKRLILQEFVSKHAPVKVRPTILERLKSLFKAH